jgi:hypothetical protein
MSLRIELSSDTIAWLSSASSVAVAIGSPVLTLARKLVGMGIDPDTTLECYRGPVHCLTIRSIGEAAKLSVASHGVGFTRVPEGRSAPPVSQNAQEAAWPMQKQTNDAVTLSSCAA